MGPEARGVLPDLALDPYDPPKDRGDEDPYEHVQ